MFSTEKVITSLLKYARPELLKKFRTDSCIVSTAVGIDVMNYFGILAEPVAVRTFIFNKSFVARIESGQSWPNSSELNRWVKEDNSYSVGIGFGTQLPGKWAGHLVAVVEKKYLIDLSIDQATRPKYNMSFKALCVDVDNEFLLAQKPRMFKYNECLLRIEVLPENLGYTLSPDWTFKDRRSKIVQSVINSIEGDLK